jgi:glycosyltransferase involved in cell wall biosynthesis
MMDPRPGDIGYSLQHIAAYKHHVPNVKILHRVNECDKRKGTNEIDKLLMSGMTLSNKVVFISTWLKEYFTDLGFEGNNDVIYNGCNTEHFYPKDRNTIGKKVRVVTHHWSDNWMKGFDLYTRLDEYLLDYPDTNIDFTYIGRYYKNYKPKATKIINPTHGIDLGNKLREHDVYVTASRFEPCGMHHIEGSASGLPVLYHSEDNFDEFLSGLNTITNNYNDYKNKIDYKNLDINICVNEYIKIIESIT